MKKTKKAEAPAANLPQHYEPTPSELEAIKAFAKARSRQRTPPVKIKKQGGKAVAKIDHRDPAIGHMLIMQSIGTTNSDFYNGLITQLGNVGSTGKEISQDGFNFMLSMVQGIEPRDQVEAMLAAQMAATHNATMTFARRLAHVETLPQQDSAERAFNKLARTFAAQVEALKRYRSSGDQTMRVEHVTVNEGGQAIVGNVSSMGRGGSEKTPASS